MTIRELMKVYKKVGKAVSVYSDGIDKLYVSGNMTWDETAEVLASTNKAVRTLQKLAEVAGVSFKALMDNAFDEDTFVLWARANKLDFSKDSAEENGEETEGA